MKNILFCIFFFCLCISCKKMGNATVKGTVREIATGSPIANATIYLYKSPADKSNPDDLVATTTSDNNGDYIINYYKDWARGYGLIAKAVNYHSSRSINNIPEDNRAFNVDPELVPFAYVKLRFKKNTTSLNHAGVQFESKEIWSPYKNYLYIYDTILPTIYSTYGNQSFDMWKYVYFMPTQNPDHSATREPIYINKGETLTYLVEFN